MFFESHDVHVFELKSFRGVHRHQVDFVVVVVFVVGVGEEGDVDEEVGQALGFFVERILHKALQGIQQFLHILIARHTFGRLVRVQRVHQSGTLGNGQTDRMCIGLIGFGRERRHHAHKVTQFFPRRTFQCGRGHAILGMKGLPKADFFACRVGNEFVHGRLADAAGGIVDHALEAFVVVGVDGQAEIRQQILDFLALVERQPAVNAVGDVQLAQTLFKGPRLGIGPVQDGEVLVLALVVAAHFENAVGHKPSFVVV